MLGRTNTGGGGASLNFKVVGGTTAPSNPKENTIWVNTDTEVTGYVFGSTEPETTANGMVWVATGTQSGVAFNALKKNGVMVYPVSAKQYIGGAWVKKTAKSYQGGAWVDWSKDLFNNGAVCEFSTYKENNATLTIGDVITAQSTSGTWGHRWAVSTKDKIDVTPFTKLCMDATFTYVTEESGFGVLSEAINDSTDFLNGAAALQVAKVALNTNGTRFEVDVSGISGQYHCCVWGQGDSSRSTDGTITRIWLE